MRRIPHSIQQPNVCGLGQKNGLNFSQFLKSATRLQSPPSSSIMTCTLKSALHRPHRPSPSPSSLQHRASKRSPRLLPSPHSTFPCATHSKPSYPLRVISSLQIGRYPARIASAQDLNAFLQRMCPPMRRNNMWSRSRTRICSAQCNSTYPMHSASARMKVTAKQGADAESKDWSEALGLEGTNQEELCSPLWNILCQAFVRTSK
jgi:hypothetical protein